MKFFSNPRFLVTYSGVLTAAFLAAVLGGFAQNERKTTFAQIDVQRINVVGPDGKTQLVISNRQEMPEAILDGKTFTSHGRHDGAGLIFYNAEGDEDGGLVFSGRRTSGGYQAGGGLLFDQYKQDQTVGIEYEDENGQRSAGLHVWDRPNKDLAELMEQRVLPVEKMPNGPAKTAALNKLRQEGLLGASRVFVGKAPDEKALLTLSDAKGRPRLRLSVTPDGQAAVEFLNAEGKAVNRVVPPRE
ncbi:MAG TPA: hypothetical protein VGS20_08525 [Candidatus Acidoferrales bacterium]|nr:hypothetical protein [Candidatus Acidoferrales bacterium]